MKIPMSPWN